MGYLYLVLIRTTHLYYNCAVLTDESLSYSLNALIDLYEYLTQQVRKLTNAVHEHTNTEKYTHREKFLINIPGIGVLNAM